MVLMKEKRYKRPAGEMARFFFQSVYVDTDDCILWPYGTSHNGYGKMYWNKKHYHVHRLACILVHGEPTIDRAVAAHGPCHNKLCFNPKHISWKSTKENMGDKKRDGTLLYGEMAHRAKLTTSEVIEIRERYQYGNITHAKLAVEYEVSKSSITELLQGKTWKHLLP